MRWKRNNRWDWTKWFAWYPVEVEDDTYVWLETVERKFYTHSDRYSYRIPE